MDRVDRILRLIRRLKYVVGALVLIGLIAYIVSATTGGPEEVQFSRVEQLIVNNQVQQATLYDNNHVAVVRDKSGNELEARYVSDGGNTLQTLLIKHRVPFTVESYKGGLLSLLSRSWLVIFLAAWFIMILFLPQLMAKLMSGTFSGRGDYLAERPKERFSDVKGADEAIKELKLVVGSLKNPEKYTSFKPDRGILFYGPTGTGKTLLAKAVAGEAGVPFYRLAGARFESMWAGATSQKIETFFTKVRKALEDPMAPAVIFIDEIDGVATARIGDRMADRDRNTAVTQLLDQISNLFDYHPNVVIIGATNRLEALDEAVKRAGRLGKHIAMPNPDVIARQHILELNGQGMQLSDVDWESVAHLTEGMSGASVAQIPNEAAGLAFRRNDGPAPLTQHDIERAAMQIVMGTLRESAAMTAEELKIVAIHESGHATVAHASEFHRLLVATSIPIGESGGSTWCPLKSTHFLTEEAVRWQLAVMMGGREAEKLDGKSATTGSSHDIQAATSLIVQAICQGGLFTEEPVGVDPSNWEAHPMAKTINQLIQQLLGEASLQAREILITQESFRRSVQEALCTRRILHSNELEELATNSAA